MGGTFNAMEARGLGASDVTDRIAKASEGYFTRLSAIRFAWGGGEVREVV